MTPNGGVRPGRGSLLRTRALAASTTLVALALLLVAPATASHVEGGEGLVAAFGSLTTGRSDHASAFVAAGDCPSGCVFLLGGSTSAGVTRDIVRYDPSAPKSDTLLVEKLLVPRSSAAVATLGSRIYLFGGASVDGTTGTAEVYDVATNVSTRLTVPETVPLHYEGISAVALDGSIYLFGGCASASCTSAAWKFTPGGSPEWEALPLTNAPARGHMAGATNGTHVFLAGGLGYAPQSEVASYSAQVLVYEPGATTLVEQGPLPHALGGARAFWAGERLYVVGGYNASGSAVTGEVYRHDGASAVARVDVITPGVGGRGLAWDGARAFVTGGLSSTTCVTECAVPARSTDVHTIAPDLAAPTVSIELSPASPGGLDGWYTRAVTAFVNATDAHEGALVPEVSTDGVSFTARATLLLENGTWTVTARAKDASGNLATATRALKVDASPPTVAVALSPDAPDGLAGHYVSAPTAALSTTSGDVSTGGLSYSTDGGATFATGASFTFPHGETTLLARAVDAAGNAATTSVGPILVDTVPPTATSSGSVSGETGTIAFTFSEPMHADHTLAALVGASGWSTAWSAGDTVLTLTRSPLPVGTHTLTVGTGATDAHGRALAAPVSHSVTRPEPAPPPPPPPPPPRAPDAPVALAATLTGTDVRLGWSPPLHDNGAPVTGYVVYVDGGAGVPVAGTYHEVLGLARGARHTFAVSAVNSAGEGPAATTSVDLAPLSALVAPAPAATGWHTAAPTLRFDVEPAHATLLYDLGGGELAYAGPFALADGETRLRWRASAGGVHEAPREASFRVDTAPPLISDARATGGSGLAIRARVADATSGLAAVEALVTPRGGSPTLVPLAPGEAGAYEAILVAAPGEYDVIVVAHDAAGHRAEASAGSATVVEPPAPTPPPATPTAERTDAGEGTLLEETSTSGTEADEGQPGDAAPSTPTSASASEDEAPEPAILIEQGDDVEVDLGAGARGVVTVRLLGVRDLERVRIVIVAEDGTETELAAGATEAAWDTTGVADGYYAIEARRAGAAPGEGELAILSSHETTLASARVLVRNPSHSAVEVAGAVAGTVLFAAAVHAGLSAAASGATGGASSAAGHFDLFGFAQEVAIDAGEDKLRDKTRERDRKRRVRSIVAGGVSLAILAPLWAFSETEGWSATEWIRLLPIVGVAAVIVIGMKYSAESALAYATAARPRVRLWIAGTLSLVLSAVVFRNPFGYPAYVDEVDESEERSTWRMQGLRALATIAGAASFMLPFLLLAPVAPWSFVSIGLLLAATNLATSAIPLGPLPGRDVWRWSRPLALVTALGGFLVYVGFAAALAPLWSLWAVALAGGAAYAVALVRFRRTLGRKAALRVPVAVPVRVDAEEAPADAPEARKE